MEEGRPLHRPGVGEDRASRCPGPLCDTQLRHGSAVEFQSENKCSRAGLAGNQAQLLCAVPGKEEVVRCNHTEACTVATGEQLTVQGMALGPVVSWMCKVSSLGGCNPHVPGGTG